jgi:hypothetical protein
MHEMKDKMILRILGQESPKSELRLQRYGGKSSRDLFVISRMWLRLYLEIYSESRGSIWNFVECGLILKKYRGLFVKLAWIFGLGFIFEWENVWTWLTARGPGALAGPSWTCEQG